ncbi:MAG: AAA family ATPase [Armatimonadota bacterium]|nr:AAA family ATPase [Armatimonadota bacterium]MDR7421332.1 AAA family ATPase [Armatimonadota bacterium]MDR7457763.1 AAA family ATPase [Armatimonadota bacterium]MDR7497650.1 AAA family ATPase [Armatimonadota bacterium]MDR7511809.1 AAA family ATPase [Armatimonadota bacterium]
MDVETFRATFEAVRRQMQRVIVGHEALIDHTLMALLANGHVLLEGVPGLGKTLLVKTLAQCLDLRYARIQFTPDLMPADIIGTTVVLQDDAGRRYFEFQRGPIFSQIVLADEINRATPKTQSALLEAMQERQVSVSGAAHPLEEPFLVLATQNPIEMEGTYPLPEAQVDRFLFKLKVDVPTIGELVEIMERTAGPPQPPPEVVATGETIRAMQAFAREVPAAEHVKTYTARLVRATHPRDGEASSLARRYVRYGSSPRGAQALLVAGKVRALMEGRANVSVEDVAALALPALRHRVLLNFEGEAESVDPDDIIQSIVAELPPAPATATWTP